MFSQKINQKIMCGICVLGFILPFQMAFAESTPTPSNPEKMEKLLKKLEAKGHSRSLKETKQLLLLRLSLFNQIVLEGDEKSIKMGKILSKKSPDDALLKPEGIKHNFNFI